ncbi:glycoside hydrolase family 18 protein [Cytobacillus sp. NCCP-133]|uniref:glycoside hydrolase family 18 protein n=1 Tax=Cytobacillus sp. NCCP-133 TaxID=766848 RepID=UPI002232A6C7|nr:glycoside hydrolase family 18 protein [Cytobacillus sp. NCCP-133]GLB61288.1 hypothetical protein NCCP133_34180 [Cytobacillus sp. NCCP-133]
MNNYKIIILVAIIFTCGFAAGIFYTKNDQPQSIKLAKTASQSAKSPVKKNAPDLSDISSKVLIGYVQDYRDPNAIDYTNLTHIIFSFAHPERDGSLSFNGNTAMNNLRKMVKNAHNQDTKAILAVGGWFHIKGGESYEYFKVAMADPTSRDKLVNELAGIAERENLDGIDIDFEHPRSKKDAEHLSAFIHNLSKRLHANEKELSVAVHAKIHSVTGTETGFVLYEPSMFQRVDYVNIMAYDGQWDGGYNASNLSPFPFTENIVNYWATLFDSLNLSKNKLVLGVPFYAQPEDPAIKQVSYEAIIKRNPEYASRDNINLNGTTYYYNGESTMQKKTNLALNNGFGGMMIWEVGLDASGPNSLTGAIAEVLMNTETVPIKYYSVKNSFKE